MSRYFYTFWDFIVIIGWQRPAALPPRLGLVAAGDRMGCFKQQVGAAIGRRLEIEVGYNNKVVDGAGVGPGT